MSGADARLPVRLLVKDGVMAAIDPNMPPPVSDESSTKGSLRRVLFNRELAQRIEAQGPLLVVRDLVDPLRPTWHDVSVLSEVLGGVLDACPSRRK
jgi:hypothetical protein